MSLKDKAVQKFFDGVADGRIKSGATFTQGELAETLDVSLSPLREALKLLEFQGFVKVLPRSGIEVCQSDLQRIKDCFQLRRMLEATAIENYVTYCNPSELTDSLEKHKQLLQSLNKNEPYETIRQELITLDSTMHWTFIHSLKNELIDQIYKINEDRISLIRLDSHKLTRHSLAHTIEEHIEILEAVVQSDIEGSMKAMEDHLIKAMHRSMCT